MALHFLRRVCYTSLLTSLGFAVALSGCNQKQALEPTGSSSTQSSSDSHEGHDHSEHPAPANFAAGVAELHEHYAEVKAAFAQTDQAKASKVADAALHSLAIILEALPALAAKAELSTEHLQSVKDSATTMFDCYMNIDSAIHAEKTPDYQAESDELDQAMKTIQDVLAQQKQ